MLKNGLWPKTHISPILKIDIWTMPNCRKIGVNRRDRPPPSFRVRRDVYVGYFVVLHPSDNNSHLF
jgi:hypothetical protein